ncbi:MAG: hypothetical protein OEW37_08575, partial [Rhodospirillaceae bacterium]|nr:hypothetical protein [Rhodospirillaceae bacterium]
SVLQQDWYGPFRPKARWWMRVHARPLQLVFNEIIIKNMVKHLTSQGFFFFDYSQYFALQEKLIYNHYVAMR